VIAAPRRPPVRLSSGDSPRSEDRSKIMSLPTAQKFAWSLAQTLMTCVVLIYTGDGYSVLTEADYDGDPNLIVHVYDPF
jgi:hypothetical protein